MVDVPRDLVEQIKRLEELFSVDQVKLKHITEHFISELEKGMPPSDVESTQVGFLTAKQD
jgi:hexokinase